jgi:ABC-type lipoprotein export system ATPase subunit
MALRDTVRSLYVEPELQSKTEQPALELRDVFRIYRSGTVETVALRGLDLEVAPGSFVAILGPSGCGKSTLLGLAAGLDEPSAGEVRLGGRSLARMSDDALARLRATEIAIVLQSGNLWPILSAQENVAVSLRLAGMPDAEGRARRALDEFGLGDRARHRARELSGGEQQRVALAAAAARNAPLVVADEPTGELDATNERIVLDALRRLCESHGSTVLTVTHSEQVASAADRVVEMRDGRVLS